MRNVRNGESLDAVRDHGTDWSISTKDRPCDKATSCLTGPHVATNDAQAMQNGENGAESPSGDEADQDFHHAATSAFQNRPWLNPATFTGTGPGMCNTPQTRSPIASESGESIHANSMDLTPPATPAHAGSPGTTAAFSGLSIRRDSNVNPRAQTQWKSVRTKRELPQRGENEPPAKQLQRDQDLRQTGHVPNENDSTHSRKTRSRQRTPRVTQLRQPRPVNHGVAGRRRGEQCQPLHRDSAYASMGTTSSTLPPASNVHTSGKPVAIVNTPSHAPKIGEFDRILQQDSCPPTGTAPSKSTLQPGGTQESGKNINKPARPPPPHWRPLMQSSANPEYSGMILQPDSSPISEEQLAAEIQGIYDGLSTVESKCIDIDAALAYDVKSPLGVEQWQALIALHRTLLYEHHDFLMATQHPSASEDQKGLAAKHSMPARMWKHGIHAFLEVLRHRRPDSQDYMLAFVVLAYQMMALLFETVPSFTDTWIECLGDLARYRMAIEGDREMHAIWGGVAARWYTLASDRKPEIGRLYHHLGILERPSMRKLASYTKSLTCLVPFINARDSLATFCTPIVQEEHLSQSNVGSAEASLVTFFALVFLESEPNTIKTIASTGVRLLQDQPTAKVKDFGPQLVLSTVAAVFEFGSANNILWQAFSTAVGEAQRSTRPSEAALPGPSRASATPSLAVTSASLPVIDLYFASFNALVQPQRCTQSEHDMLGSVHVILAWFYSLHSLDSRCNDESVRNTISSLVDPDRFFWAGLCSFLNGLCLDQPIEERMFESARRGTFPKPSEPSEFVPLGEDYWMHGTLWVHFYLPKDVLPPRLDAIESSQSSRARTQRVQWLALSLTSWTKHVQYDVYKKAFWAPVSGPASELHVGPADPAVPNPSQTDRVPTAGATTRAAVSCVPTSPAPTSRSSTALSTTEDSEGYTVVGRNKAKRGRSYANVAARGGTRKRRADVSNVIIADPSANPAC